MLSCAPLAKKRDGLGFEDRQATQSAGRNASNGQVVAVGDGAPAEEHSLGFSGSVNALEGLAPMVKQRGAGRPTYSRDKAPYEGLNKRTRFCSICRRQGHKENNLPRTWGCLEAASQTREV